MSPARPAPVATAPEGLAGAGRVDAPAVQVVARQYRALRAALDAAYAATVWDADGIARIASAMLPLERALARHGNAAPSFLRQEAEDRHPDTGRRPWPRSLA